MAKKFGYGLSNRRNREIFGPNYGQIVIAVIIILSLVGLLFVMLEGGDEEEGAVQEAEEATPQEAGAEAVAQANAACSLPELPIVEFTEETVYGDQSKDDTVDHYCRRAVESKKRDVARLFSKVKSQEKEMLDTEQALGDKIAGLESTLKQLYAERDKLELVRTCKDLDTINAPQEEVDVRDSPEQAAIYEQEPETAVPPQEPAIELTNTTSAAVSDGAQANTTA